MLATTTAGTVGAAQVARTVTLTMITATVRATTMLATTTAGTVRARIGGESHAPTVEAATRTGLGLQPAVAT